MPVSPRQLYRFVITGELHGQMTQTLFHAISPTNSTAGTVAVEVSIMYTEFVNNVIPAYKAFCSQEWHLLSVSLIQLTANPGIIVDGAFTGGGVQTDNSLPSFCAGVLSLRTGLTGRTKHGRLYIPGVSENLSSASKLEGNYLGVLQSLGNLLVNRYGASGSTNIIRLGVFSRKLGVVRNPGPPPSLTYSTNGLTIITAAIARPEIATMRKRKLARGQ